MKFCSYYYSISILVSLSFFSCTNKERSNERIKVNVAKQSVRPNYKRDILVNYDSDNNNRVLFDTVYCDTIKVGNNRFRVNYSLIYKQYKIEAQIDWLGDSIPDTEHNQFNPIPLKQLLRFSDKNNAPKAVFLPIRRINAKASSGQSVNILDNIISSIGIIKGDNWLVVIVGGYGGCNSCSEFTGYFTLNGDILRMNYRSQRKIYLDTGYINNIINTYKLNERELSRAKYSRITIY